MKEKDSIAAESSKTDIRAVPDPEVPEKAVRRKFTAAYKLRIVKEAQTCTTLAIFFERIELPLVLP